MPWYWSHLSKPSIGGADRAPLGKTSLRSYLVFWLIFACCWLHSFFYNFFFYKVPFSSVKFLKRRQQESPKKQLHPTSINLVVNCIIFLVVHCVSSWIINKRHPLDCTLAALSYRLMWSNCVQNSHSLIRKFTNCQKCHVCHQASQSLREPVIYVLAEFVR